jgi:hypothetical protein
MFLVLVNQLASLHSAFDQTFHVTMGAIPFTFSSSVRIAEVLALTGSVVKLAWQISITIDYTKSKTID